MNYVALICARGGSKGLPGKNLLPLANIPLIGWSINSAKKIDRISRIIVSTDSSEIAEVARDYGAEVPFLRPAELSMDNSPEWLVWRHAIQYLSKDNSEILDGLVSLPPTAPLRLTIDIEKCLDEFEKGEVDTVITVSDSHRNPYFNMISNNEKGYSSILIPSNSKIERRQDAPTVFDMTTVCYVASAKFICENSGIFDGRVRSVKVPRERAIDIDTLIDFKIAEFFIKNQEAI